MGNTPTIERNAVTQFEMAAGLAAECSRSDGLTTRLARQLVLRQLDRIRRGRLMIHDGCDSYVLGRTDADGLSVNVTVNDSRFYRRLATGGSLGLAESYLEAEWDANDLPSLFRLFSRNLSSFESADRGLASLAKCAARLGHWLARNTRRQSRRNIEAHYDLGNDFFQLFLDPSMMYSSGTFESEGMSLEDAQSSRLDRVCSLLNLSPNDHVVEIGTGWGGFAMYAARNYGCRVTTTTISQQQYDYARRRVSDAGLESRIEILDRDYRDLRGKFDKLVSLEMIEAVGHAFYDQYFRKCGDLLKPDGRMLLQAIVIPEQRYKKYLKSVDFIQKYIFPGGCLPSVTSMIESVQRVSRLRIHRVDDFASSYAQTLREWRKRFLAKLDDVRDLGYSERFIRMWDYYLCYCEGAFDERAVGVVHAMWGK